MATGLASKKAEATELLSRLSLKQKIQILSGASVWTLKEVPFLKIPAIWLCDGPHGLRKQEQEYVTDLLTGRVSATCFPTSSCLACSWDPSLLERVGTALGKESRAHQVTVLLGPGINLIRDPRGGRSFEYFSEDPYLTGVLASAMIDGVQSQGVGVSLKHFYANNQETWRFVVDAVVDERTLRELYERAFEYVIRKSQPWTIMCAYNQVNGVYCSELKEQYTRIREEWGFEGLVVTDWGATCDRPAAIAAGCDLEMPGSHGACDQKIERAIEKNRLTEAEVNACAIRVLSLMLLGKDIMSGGQRPDVEYLEDHHALAREAATKSVVLLKNENSLLPLKNGVSVSVFGEFADDPRYQGMGSSEVYAYKVDRPIDRMKEYAPDFKYGKGLELEDASNLASQTDVAIIFCGLSESDESEGFDRPHIDIPKDHEALIDAVSKANSKTIVVLSNGAPVDISSWESRVPAIFESFLSGQAGGSAVVDLIFGNSSPSGKLSQTVPLSIKDTPAYKWFPGTDQQVQYREGLNVGYRYYDSAGVDVQFPFGHGLSYTTFEYTNLNVEVQTDTKEDISVTVSLQVKNTGNMEAEEIVQCYIHDCETSVYRPEQELNAFGKIALKPNEQKNVTLELDQRAFMLWDIGANSWIVEPGDFEIRIGSSSRDIRLNKKISLESGNAASQEARKSSPPRELPMNSLPDSDEDFESLLGKPIPPSPTNPTDINYNTLVADTQNSMLGRFLKKQIVDTMNQNIEDHKKESQGKFAEELAENTPLRNLVLWSRGILTFKMLDIMIAQMNGNYLTLLFKAPWAMSTYFWHKCFADGNRLGN